MKNKSFICILFICIPFMVNGEYKAGFYLSMGQMHYSLKNFADTPDIQDMELKDLLMEASIQLKNKLEINLFYNRFNGIVNINGERLTFDKDGFGIEIGKLILKHLNDLVGQLIRIACHFCSMCQRVLI